MGTFEEDFADRMIERHGRKLATITCVGVALLVGATAWALAVDWKQPLLWFLGLYMVNDLKSGLKTVFNWHGNGPTEHNHEFDCHDDDCKHTARQLEPTT